MLQTRFLPAVSFALAAGCYLFAAKPPPIRVDYRDGIEHCSAFVLANDGHGIFGCNFDHTLTDEGLVFVNKRGVAKSSVNGGASHGRVHWTTRYASVSFNLVGYEYAWGGMNERGLTVSTMSLDETRQPPPDERPPLDNGEWVQYILDTCATVEEVIATDSQVRILTVDHYLIGDRFGNAATIEFLDGRMVAHAAPNLPVAALTNNTYEELFATWERLRRYGNYAGQNSSFHRFCLAADRVDGFQSTTDAGAVAYAFDTLHLVRGERFSASPTNWSLVFDTKNLRAYYRTSRNYEIRWVDLRNLDLRCGAPVMMIDIHDGGPGDVADELFDFDSNLNRYHLERFLDIWGVNLPPSSISWILNHLESFDCVRPHRRASSRRVAP
jgi:penicillin V acylase-like amidase (Ntn superfamily)